MQLCCTTIELFSGGRTRQWRCRDCTPERVTHHGKLCLARLVRGTRTGKSTGRLDEVLDGHLDQFFTVQDQQEEPEG